MQYLVHGTDNDGVDDKLEALAEEHWAYMDRHADRLVARGPTLSSDGENHTGSVHVVEVATLDEVRRFAFQEPYWLAGVYASVTVTRMQNALPGTMWDRPPAPPGQASTLTLARWPAEAWTQASGGVGHTLAMIAAHERLVFGGLLVNDESTLSLGLVVAVDVVAQPTSIVTALGAPNTVTSAVTHRWQRGGRHQV